MLNIKVTNRMVHEDYVAQRVALPYVLPRKHILGIVTTFAISAAFVLPMPSTWEMLDNDDSLTAGSRAYLSENQSAHDDASGDTHNENYEDYDIPSQFFTDKSSSYDEATAAQASKDELDDVFAGGEDESANSQHLAAAQAHALALSKLDAAKKSLNQSMQSSQLAQKISVDKKAKEDAAHQGVQTAQLEQERASRFAASKMATLSAQIKNAKTEREKKKYTAELDKARSDADKEATRLANNYKKAFAAQELAAKEAKEAKIAAENEVKRLEQDKVRLAMVQKEVEQTKAAEKAALAKYEAEEEARILAEQAEEQARVDAAEAKEEELAAKSDTTDKKETGTGRPEGEWYTLKITRGDTLYSMFTDLDLPQATLNRLTKAGTNRDLRLRLNDPVYFLIDKDNVLKEFVKTTSRTEQVRFTRMGADDDFTKVIEPKDSHMPKELLAKVNDAFKMPSAVANAKAREERQAALAKARAEKAAALAKAKAEREERERLLNNNPNRPRLLIGSIEKGESFRTAAHRVGLTPREVTNIEGIFKSKVNVRRLKVGTKFRALFTGIGTKATLAAIKLEAAGTIYESFLNPRDSNYYEENEYMPTAGIFRRFPMAGDIKVTSHFNPARRHPVTRRVSPHNGVDFKATVGSAVYAPADGVVTFSGYQRAAGYYIIISHANNFSTVYMHLSKSEVKKGQKVLVGQLIARSGNTGRTTGPHLHYEIRINDRPVDPLKVELPSSNHPNLAREQREAFANNVKLLRSELLNDKLAAVQAKK